MRELREKRIVVKSGDEIVHDLPLEEFLQLPRTALINAVVAANKGHPRELEEYCQRTDTEIIRLPINSLRTSQTRNDENSKGRSLVVQSKCQRSPTPVESSDKAS